MKRNKFLSLGMVFVMLVTMMMGAVPSAAMHTELYRVGDYEFSSDGVLTKYYGTSPDVIIPETLTSGSAITITAIGQGAFNGSNNTTVRFLWLPNTVTKIEPFAFAGCSNLGPNLTLPKSITQIGDLAFERTKLDTVTFAGDAPTMGRDVFANPFPNPNFKIYYLHGSKGFGSTIGGYPCSEKPYTIKVNSTEHGVITTTASALEGDLVNLEIKPEPGYSVGKIEYRGENIQGRVAITGNSFIMPASNVEISTDFGYAVKSAPVANGSVAGWNLVESEGNLVNVMNYPSPGYRIKAGSLKYTFNGQTTMISKNNFIMPKGDVTLSCEFEPSPYKWDKQTLDSANKASLVCADPAGNLYVLVQTSTTGQAPALLELHKRVNGVWSKTGIAPTKGVDRIMSMAADSSGRVYMVDKSNDLYTYTSGQRTLEEMDFGKEVSVMGIAVDASDHLYVADYDSASILKRAKGSTLWTTASTNAVIGSVDNLVMAVDADGTQYMTPLSDDSMGILKKSPSSSTWETLTPKDFKLGIALSVGANGTLYVADPYTAVIHKLEKGATDWTVVDMGGYAQVPFSMACDRDGQLAIISESLDNVERGGDLYTLANSCTVTFDYNGGLGSSSKVVSAGSTLGALPSTPTRNAYTFDGWNTNKEGTGTAVTESTIVSANVVVYAKWKAVTTSGGTAAGGGGASNGGSGASTAPSTPAKPVTVAPPITPAASVSPMPSPTPARPAPAKPTATPPATPPAPFKAKLNKDGVAAVQVEVKDLKDDFQQALRTKEKELALGVEAPKGAKSVEAELSKEVMKATKDSGIKRLALDTSLAKIVFNEQGLRTLQKSSTGDVKVSFEQKQVNGRIVYDINVLSNGKAVKGLAGNLEVSMPYKLGKGEAPNNLKFYVTDDKGKPVQVKGAVYDEKTKRVKFKR